MGLGGESWERSSVFPYTSVLLRIEEEACRVTLDNGRPTYYIYIVYIRWEMASSYHEPQRGKTTLQSFRTLSRILSNWTCFTYSQMRKFLQGLNRELIEQLLICCLHKRYRYWWKPNTQRTSWCLEWSLVVTTFIFPHGFCCVWVTPSGAFVERK